MTNTLDGTGWDNAYDGNRYEDVVDEADVDPTDLPDWEDEAPQGYTVVPRWHATPEPLSRDEAEWLDLMEREQYRDAMADAYYA